MHIERGTDKYYEDTRELVRQFCAESLSEYGMQLDEATLASTWAELHRDAFLLIIDGKCVGILAGREVKTPIGDEKIWHEVVWFVSLKHRRHGLRLFRTARDILRREGYSHIVMILMENSKAEKLSRYYERLGLRPLERHYIGAL
jgi:predicted acetyltransferase